MRVSVRIRGPLGVARQVKICPRRAEVSTPDPCPTWESHLASLILRRSNFSSKRPLAPVGCTAKRDGHRLRQRFPAGWNGVVANCTLPKCVVSLHWFLEISRYLAVDENETKPSSSSTGL